jgi:D-glycero-D-manno-heptose 1,7-bisphosphate phosphatase
LDDVFFVLNGDTIFDIDCQELSRALEDEPSALAALALREVNDASRYGSVAIHQGFVSSFTEKSSRARGVISGGIYCLRKAALAVLPSPPCSLEKDLFPRLASGRVLLGRVFDGYFIDIGLAETLTRAQVELPAWQAGFHRTSPS